MESSRSSAVKSDPNNTNNNSSPKKVTEDYVQFPEHHSHVKPGEYFSTNIQGFDPFHLTITLHLLCIFNFHDTCESRIDNPHTSSVILLYCTHAGLQNPLNYNRRLFYFVVYFVRICETIHLLSSIRI